MNATPAHHDTVTDGASDEVAGGEGRFPGLRVEQQLGVGGSGVVYRALDAARGRHVALKVLRADRWGSEAQRSRFRREVEIHRRIVDPGVVGIFADGTTPDGAPWFTMELIDGASLQDRIDRAALPPLAACVSWIRDVARTLARLHAQGVVHRDVKPSNILLHDGRARLADFGVVLLSDEERLTVGPRAVGTPRFMAPEQLSGTVGDWRLVDVYALGLVLAELLGPGRSSLDLRHVIRRATAAAPRDRYPGADALADELERWLAGRAVRLRPSALAWRLRRSPWMTGLPRIAAIAAALVLVGFVAARLQAAQRDARAEADWAIARTGLARAWATGDVQAADDWVARFATDPARQRTPAAGHAWLELAALHRDSARSEAEQAALGRALAATDDPGVRTAAISELVAMYRRLRRWPALGHLLGALPAEGVTLDDGVQRAARADLALAMGDVAAAISATPDEAPLLAPLQALRAAPLATLGALDSDGDGALEWVVGEAAARDPVRARDEHGAWVWRFGPAEGARFRDEGGRGWLYTETGLWTLDAGGATRIAPHSSAAAQVGARVFGVVVAAPRTLAELTAGASSPAHAATEALGAYVQGVAAGDVDGDGARELVVAFGPAGGFLVRVYRAEADAGPLVALAGTRPGDVGSVAVVDTPAGPRIVGLLIRVNPSAAIFGAEDPWGAPCGVQTWRYDQTTSPPQLLPVAHHDLPPGYCEANMLQVADLDGDGDGELLVNQWSRQSAALLVLRHRDDELTRAFSLADHEATSVARVRGRDVVLLSHVVSGGHDVLGRWFVGAGDQQLPRRAWNTASIDPGADPTVRLFAACSLDRSAAESCAQRGDSARAARFLERAGEPAGAALALAEAARTTGDADTLAYAVDLAIAGADAPLARGLIDQLAALAPERGAAKTAEYAARLTPGWALDLTRTLPADVQVIVPAALRHDLANRELRVRVPAGIGEVLRVPLRATGGPVWLHAAGELTRTEWGCVADLRIRRPGAAESPYKLNMMGTGAGGVLFRDFDNLTRDRVAQPGNATPIDLRVDTTADGLEIHGAWNHQVVSRRTSAEPTRAGESWELVVLGVAGGGAPPGPLCELVLRQLDLGGFELASAPPVPPAPAIAWAAGGADPPPGEPADDPAFVALLRLDPSLLGRVRAHHGPDAADRLFQATWSTAARMHRSDDQTVEAMLGMGELAGVPPAQRLWLRVARSEALIRVGRPTDARAALVLLWHDATALGQPSWREAFEAAALLAELDLSAGDDAGARLWVQRAAEVVPDADLGERLLRHRPRLREQLPGLIAPIRTADRARR